MKRAFTLVEVNLAMLIMAGGILSIVGLYAFGFRENRQSAEDVASAAYADAVISPLVMAISATNLKWSVFKNMPSYPSEAGWKDYFDSNGLVTSDPENRAQDDVFGNVMKEMSKAAKGSFEVNTQWPSTASGGLRAGLVVIHDQGSAIVRIAFRATKRPSMLLSAPLYYTEVRFQGIVDE